MPLKFLKNRMKIPIRKMRGLEGNYNETTKDFAKSKGLYLGRDYFGLDYFECFGLDGCTTIY